EDGIRDDLVTGVQTCALPIYLVRRNCLAFRPTERDWADLRGLGADAEVLSGIGGCAARQTSRAVVTLASGQPAASALGTSPPVRSEERRVGKERRAG